MNSQSMLRVVEKKRVYEDIVQQVLTLIEDGKLKRGDQLPSERELADKIEARFEVADRRPENTRRLKDNGPAISLVS